MIKSVLKILLPKIFLKKAFEFYNKIKISTIDKVVFPEYDINHEEFILYRRGYPFRENSVDIDSIRSTAVKSYMRQWYDWTQEEFILVFDKPCVIEPVHGWAIVPPNKLLYYSLGISRTWFLSKPHIIGFFLRNSVQSLKTAISLRDTGEENYFHFYNDVLSKIFFLEKNGIDIEVPMIVSRKLWTKTYFQYYLQKSEKLKSLQWIVQDKQYIHCQKAIFCKPLTHRTDLFELIFKPLYSIRGRGYGKIYITRNKSRLRYIENSDEIESLCRKHSFEIVDSDILPLQQQIEIFSSAFVIVGIHGAGLTNVYFNNNHAKVLEIFPPANENYLPFHYIMLSEMKGLTYDAIVGEKGTGKFPEGFYLDPVQFENSLKLILS
jgi:hypothetical protein